MKVNGKEIKLDLINEKGIQGLLEYYKIKPSSVAIELNGEIIPREYWTGTKLKENDSIELIKFVGGG